MICQPAVEFFVDFYDDLFINFDVCGYLLIVGIDMPKLINPLNLISKYWFS